MDFWSTPLGIFALSVAGAIVGGIILFTIERRVRQGIATVSTLRGKRSLQKAQRKLTKLQQQLGVATVLLRDPTRLVLNMWASVLSFLYWAGAAAFLQLLIPLLVLDS